MRVTYAVILTLAFIAASSAFPSASPGGRDEIIIVPLEKNQGHYGDQPIIDTGIIGDDGTFPSPFESLFESLAGIMMRMRQQMDSVFGRLPQGGNSTEDESRFPGLRFPQIDLGKGNTTSVTKIIDGHKVVINETEYKQDGDLGGTFFKVRIIDVKPDSSEVETEKAAEAVTSTTARDIELVENSFENEIPKNKEAFDNIETFDEVDSSSSSKNTEWNSVEAVESFEDNSIDSPRPAIDLSGDIYVNKLMADRGAPTDPDAEVFSVDGNPPAFTRGQPFERMMINPR